MNFRFVICQLGALLLILSLCMAAVALWAGWQWWGDAAEEWAALVALGISLAVGIVAAAGLLLGGRRSGLEYLGRREALLLVALSWFLGAALAGLPYWVWAQLNTDIITSHEFLSFASCYFEAMSGLTTTGATVLGGEAGHRIADLPRGLLLWRSLTHWLGGVGIVVLFVAVLPTLGVGGKRIFQVESLGPKSMGMRPRITETARALWLIYLAMTAAAIIALRLCGLGWFDSVCHSFSMVSTGGLSTRDASVGAYDSAAVEVVCMFFMLAAGVNFALYFRLVQGRIRSIGQDTELRVYIALKVGVIIAVTASLLLAATPIVTTGGGHAESSMWQALRYGAFQTISLHTGTGFCSADYENWPFFCRAMIIGLMFVGGCAGSTAGGIKVIRVWIVLKVLVASIEKTFRPNVVRTLRVGNSVIDADQRLASVVYFLAILLLFGLGTFALMVTEPPGGRCDFQTAMSATISTLSNVGPGLYEVGATKNYAWFTGSSKCILSILMCLGRLELYAIFVLFLPRFWYQA